MKRTSSVSLSSAHKRLEANVEKRHLETEYESMKRLHELAGAESYINELEMRMRDLQQKVKSVSPWNAQSLADEVDELTLQSTAATDVLTAMRATQYDERMRDLRSMLIYIRWAISPLRLSYSDTS